MARGGSAGGFVDLEISEISLNEMVEALGDTPKQVDKAMASALRKMAIWLKAKSIKGLSKELDIQQKVIRRRLKSFSVTHRKDGSSARVWYGLDPIKLRYLGTPEVIGHGVQVGAFYVEGAFIAKDNQGNMQVFKRKGRARLPIEVQTADINDRAEKWVEDRLLGSDEFTAQFFKLFEHELKWQTKTRR